MALLENKMLKLMEKEMDEDFDDIFPLSKIWAVKGAAVWSRGTSSQARVKV